FFQAEDGIRDFHVTGVQTCALPISLSPPSSSCSVPIGHNIHKPLLSSSPSLSPRIAPLPMLRNIILLSKLIAGQVHRSHCLSCRSEERRVGNEGRAREAPDHGDRCK